MEHLIHRTPSVGGLIKKLVEINPELTTQELIQLVRQSTRPQGSTSGEFTAAEVVDEAKALSLAKASLTRTK